jgi:anti-sigma regulatory factor (Ser/Thr protein kinase)
VTGTSTVATVRRDDGFRHEALLYAGPQEFVERTSALLHRWTAGGDEVLVVVPAAKIDALRGALDGDADLVRFEAMETVGRNPACIIPAWREFVEERGGAGRSLRGIGEPIWAGRSPEELVECQQHEALLNVAFAGTAPWSLVCPYDRSSLAPHVIEEARRAHPIVREDGVPAPSASYTDRRRFLDGPLGPPPTDAVEVPYDLDSLARLRTVVAAEAARAGVARSRVADLVVAVSEVATNSVRHAGGDGVARLWTTVDALVCECRDGGRIGRPLAGRERPPADAAGGLGLWLVNHLCDLVQIRTGEAGTVVRLHVRRGALA